MAAVADRDAEAGFGDLVAGGWRVVIAASGTGLVDRARDVLAERGIAARAAHDLDDVPEPGVAVAVIATLEGGFELPDAKLAVLTEAEFYGRTIGADGRVVKKLASRRKNVVDPLQLKAGDFVVHSTHGIGRFVELVQREVSTGGRNAVKTQREYLVIEYAPAKRGYPGDKLFVPTDQLDLLSRYVGGEAPVLSKMGGSDWAAAKGKAPVAVPAKAAALAPRREPGVRAGYVKPATPRPERIKPPVQRERVELPAGYKPTAKEEYMGPMQLEYFRQRLLQWRGDLVEESKQTIEILKEEVRDVGDEAERATRETENSLELRTRDRYRKLIGKIDSTLKRLDNGDYGFCVDTGEEIGLERMEARLTAERTIDAQERWEHLQKQMGD